jgi:hypothetical protein
MNVISGREASIFACLTDTVVAPAPMLPPVAQTDAAEAFDRWLERAPRVNAIGLRAALFAIELAPLALGFGHRLRRLTGDERARFLEGLERAKPPLVRQLTKALKSIAFLCYYGDDGLLKRLGYDPDANVARGRALRIEEGRP